MKNKENLHEQTKGMQDGYYFIGSNPFRNWMLIIVLTAGISVFLLTALYLVKYAFT